MKKIQIAQGAFLALLFASNAQAEIYDGVLQSSSVRSRADVDAEAATVAKKEDPYRDSASSGVAAPLGYSKSRDAVHAEAVKEAHSANQNLTGKAYYRDAIPSQYLNQPQQVNAAK
ncbi:hypothetical protein [Variovorax sp. OV084]|jgi:hypothetical protein|uniref:hypothetical protein n=1 Tax=Variovorax sp. OV084 TaxID=1882777 RepID=UPI0008B2AABE|nr:hypothetical protein [Variovorax sp. OV084]SES89106.1 hypothetical protein SAMN05443580_101744 [Variovorax sp. OV084]